LSPDQYDAIRSVTLVVGTNALNVPKSGKVVPLLDVVYDVEKLIYDLTLIFKNARIGVYNVIPRAFTTVETRDRIALFNDIFSRHGVKVFKNVFWIKQYWEFIDHNGYLRKDLYGKDGLHLKWKGKRLMDKAIFDFQESYF